MKNISEILENLITECECDNRISTGIFDVYNTDHLVVLSEHMQKYGISESTIESAIESIALGEGKYPERQAFNKEGWLVTFPSKEYRDAALKRGTHAISDPTHGRGGMNLYYKKKGKQKRQTAQAQTSTATAGTTPSAQPAQPASPTEPSATQTSPATAQSNSTPSSPNSSAPAGSTEEDESSYVQRRSAELKQKAADIDRKYKEKIDSADKESPEPTTPADIPSVEVPVVETPPEQYSSISKKFAQNKGWMAEPYGEYRDREGNTVAVVGLSGEVVPTKSVDRDEYKLFAEKNMV